MPTAPPSTRRDQRLPVRRGSSSVELPHPLGAGRILRGELTLISVSGLAFEVEADAGAFAPGTGLAGVAVRVGHCVLSGKVQVRASKPVGDGTRAEVGCLFVPDSLETERRWMAVVAGIEAAGPAV